MKPQKLKINPKVALQVTLPLVLFALISLQLSKNITLKKAPTPSLLSSYFDDPEHEIIPNEHDELRLITKSTSPPSQSSSSTCDLFSGEWIPNPEGPYYTNNTCWVIQEHQNCMKYERPDSDYLKWRWKPSECELPVFDAQQFLEIVKDKSLAFVGDSVARNHMQSLICLLSQVEQPTDVSNTKDDNFKRWYFSTHNFTLAILWSPYLVKAQDNDPNGKKGKSFYGLYLDEQDEVWTAQIHEFNYIIISAGHWFFRPITYYRKRTFMGCRYCEKDNLTEYSLTFGYRNAFRTAFRAILERESFKGTVYLRTFAPSHFEGGEWDDGGNCSKTRPYNNSEISLQGENLEMYQAQMEEFKEAQKLGQQRGLRFRLMDMTRLMLLRPDGHPSTYGRPAKYNGIWPSDCVHWCLPGPIDSWNEFLLQMMKAERIKSQPFGKKKF